MDKIFIELQLKGERRSITLNIVHIISVYVNAWDVTQLLTTSGTVYTVQETYDEVRGKIEEVI